MICEICNIDTHASPEPETTGARVKIVDLHCGHVICGRCLRSCLKPDYELKMVTVTCPSCHKQTTQQIEAAASTSDCSVALQNGLDSEVLRESLERKLISAETPFLSPSKVRFDPHPPIEYTTPAAAGNKWEALSPEDHYLDHTFLSGTTVEEVMFGESPIKSCDDSTLSVIDEADESGGVKGDSELRNDNNKDNFALIMDESYDTVWEKEEVVNITTHESVVPEEERVHENVAHSRVHHVCLTEPQALEEAMDERRHAKSHFRPISLHPDGDVMVEGVGETQVWEEDGVRQREGEGGEGGEGGGDKESMPVAHQAHHLSSLACSSADSITSEVTPVSRKKRRADTRLELNYKLLVYQLLLMSVFILFLLSFSHLSTVLNYIFSLLFLLCLWSFEHFDNSAGLPHFQLDCIMCVSVIVFACYAL